MIWALIALAAVLGMLPIGYDWSHLKAAEDVVLHLAFAALVASTFYQSLQIRAGVLGVFAATALVIGYRVRRRAANYRGRHRD
ncbi:hypothetical protein OO014_18975 [Intrasporangium calvum]|uniref:Uncharacterized protein n=1 Tax=Intrasporangium calvum TaxID=53358 RepID=A0ABT5GM86_9MICO|nr:hypothetical protein [Intrasporangium calvum]MDC5699337.1 hypothetical protein [Intrasporangium calvum]